MNNIFRFQHPFLNVPLSSFLIILDFNNLDLFEKALIKNNVTYNDKKVIKKFTMHPFFGKYSNGIHQSFKEWYYDESLEKIIFVQYTDEEWASEILREKHEIDLQISKEIKILTDPKTSQELYEYTKQTLLDLSEEKEFFEQLEKLGPNDISKRDRRREKKILKEFREQKSIFDEGYRTFSISFNKKESDVKSEIEKNFSEDPDSFISFLKDHKINTKRIEIWG